MFHETQFVQGSRKSFLEIDSERGKKVFFVPDNNHTTQENTGVWFFIAATPKHQIVVSNHTKNRVD